MEFARRDWAWTAPHKKRTDFLISCISFKNISFKYVYIYKEKKYQLQRYIRDKKMFRFCWRHRPMDLFLDGRKVSEDTASSGSNSRPDDFSRFPDSSVVVPIILIKTLAQKRIRKMKNEKDVFPSWVCQAKFRLKNNSWFIMMFRNSTRNVCIIRLWHPSYLDQQNVNGFPC